jgi:hypothetical protein
MNVRNLVEDHDNFGISNQQSLANALMYCKLIRDYFTRIEEAPVFFGTQSAQNSEKRESQTVSARFTLLEDDEENDEEKNEENDQKEKDLEEEKIDLSEISSFEYDHESDLE